MATKKCKQCGKPIRRKRSKYCDRICFAESIRKPPTELICNECGKPYQGRNDTPSKRRKYCSPECSAKSRRVTHELTCVRCGEPFITKRRRSRGQPFCSRQCSAENRADEVRGKKRTVDTANRRRGELSPLAKISTATAIQIKELIFSGKSPKEVSELTGVPYANVSAISLGYTWRHVGPQLKGKRKLNLLTELEVSYVKGYLKAEVPITFIAKYMKIPRGSVRRIHRGETHKKVKPRQGPPIGEYVCVERASPRERPIRLRGEREEARLDRAKQAIRDWLQPSETP